MRLLEIWNSDHWGNGKSRTLKHGERDPYDSTNWTQANGPSDTRLTLTGNGTMSMAGEHPRFYLRQNIRDVAVRCYFTRRGSDGRDWSGLTLGVRTAANGHSSNGALAHTYYFRIAHGGWMDFDKELYHPNHFSRARKTLFSGGLKAGQRIGAEFRVYDLGSNVKLEGYVDTGGGLKLVNETLDDGSWQASGSGQRFQVDGQVFIRNTAISRADYDSLQVFLLDEGEDDPPPPSSVTPPLYVNAGGGEVHR